MRDLLHYSRKISTQSKTFYAIDSFLLITNLSLSKIQKFSFISANIFQRLRLYVWIHEPPKLLLLQINLSSNVVIYHHVESM